MFGGVCLFAFLLGVAKDKTLKGAHNRNKSLDFCDFGDFPRPLWQRHMWSGM